MLVNFPKKKAKQSTPWMPISSVNSKFKFILPFTRNAFIFIVKCSYRCPILLFQSNHVQKRSSIYTFVFLVWLSDQCLCIFVHVSCCKYHKSHTYSKWYAFFCHTNLKKIIFQIIRFHIFFSIGVEHWNFYRYETKCFQRSLSPNIQTIDMPTENFSEMSLSSSGQITKTVTKNMASSTSIKRVTGRTVTTSLNSIERKN